MSSAGGWRLKAGSLIAVLIFATDQQL
ncbi:hypothetical protein ACP0HM_27890 [Escherichia coli]